MPIIELIISVLIVLLEHLLAPSASATGEDGRMRGYFFSKTERNEERLCDKKSAWIYKKAFLFNTAFSLGC